MGVVRAIAIALFLLLIGPVVSAHAQAAPIEVQKLRPNLFLLTGGNANTLVFVRSNGVAIIDTKGPRPWWGSAIADEVKELTRLPITTVINTTASGDHVGGNPEFAGSKVEIIAHENARADHAEMKLMFTEADGRRIAYANLQGSSDRRQRCRPSRVVLFRPGAPATPTSLS